MGITNSNKVLNAARVDCDGSLKVTLALTAAPDIISNPTDIALVLDRSGSMTGTPLANMKTGAKTFIDIISQSTGGQPTGEIGSGSRIGIVSFSDTATQSTQMITSVATLKNAVDSLTAAGSTNHADAFTKAIALFNPSSSNAKVIVMFTDGKTTAGAPPAPPWQGRRSPSPSLPAGGGRAGPRGAIPQKAAGKILFYNSPLKQKGQEKRYFFVGILKRIYRNCAIGPRRKSGCRRKGR